jgi:hypothetical protein
MKNPIWIFERITNINELVKELIIKEMLPLQHYQVDAKEINVLFNGGENMKPCFLQLFFSPYQILSTVGLQIEIKMNSF